MRTPILFLMVVAGFGILQEPPLKKATTTMKMNAGITTTQLTPTKDFYQRILHFGISFENDFYVLLHTPNKQAEISFFQADHPSQQPIFQSLYPGKGMYLTIEVPDVDAEYKRIKELGVKMEVEIRNEPWGDRHFSFYDPNGIGIDIVTYHAQ